MSKVALIGLGYVGLSVAAAFSRAGYDLIGFDTDETRIAEIVSGIDRTDQVAREDLLRLAPLVTSDLTRLEGADVYVVIVQTTLTPDKQPDTTAVEQVATMIAPFIRPDVLVVLSSTVPIGFTLGRFLPLLEAGSGLEAGTDFDLGFAPERFDPGNRINTLSSITKIVSGLDDRSLRRTGDLYRPVVESIVEAASIPVAEASRVIENAQRDVNLAFVNDVAHILDAWRIDTADVLTVARTKWNFLPFRPGLVGGHCIPVHPHYLRQAAIDKDVSPSLIASARQTNEDMPKRIADVCIARLERLPATVTVLGLSYKEDVPDVRGSAAMEIVRDLLARGCQVQLVDPLVEPQDLERAFGLRPTPEDEREAGDAVILAVAHRPFVEAGWPLIMRHLHAGAGLVLDVRGVLPREKRPAGVDLWRL